VVVIPHEAVSITSMPKRLLASFIVSRNA